MALDPRPRLFTRSFAIGHKGIRAVNAEVCMFYTGFYKGLVTGVKVLTGTIYSFYLEL